MSTLEELLAQSWTDPGPTCRLILDPGGLIHEKKDVFREWEESEHRGDISYEARGAAIYMHGIGGFVSIEIGDMENGDSVMVPFAVLEAFVEANKVAEHGRRIAAERKAGEA